MVLSYQLVPGSMASLATPISLGKDHGPFTSHHKLTMKPGTQRFHVSLPSYKAIFLFASSVQNWITTRKFNLVTWMIRYCQLCTPNILDSQVLFIQSIPQDPCMVYFPSFKLIFMVFLNVGKYTIHWVFLVFCFGKSSLPHNSFVCYRCASPLPSASKRRHNINSS